MRTSLGLGLGEARQSYASDIAMSYDEARNLYTGEMISRGGKYRVEAQSAAGIYNHMEDILYNEYREMTKEVVTQKHHAFASGMEERSVIVHGHHVQMTRHMEGGIPVMTLNASEYHEKELGLGDAINLFSIGSAALSAISGQWMEAAISALGMAYEDFLSKSGNNDKIYAVMFGGILITAKSRAELKKRLILQRNRRIQLIMNHIREHEEKRKKAKLASHLTSRIRDKKQMAETSWQLRTSPQGQETGWRDRSLNMRKSLEIKRKDAQLWADRTLSL